MAIDLYASCPCGSGKKFKWCCQPIEAEIGRAFQLDGEGQHEAALKLMEEIVAKNEGNPEAWGRKGQLLLLNGQIEAAEQAVQEALKINPKYAFGFLLQGMFRDAEGELEGSLVLFRKAADLYPPDAREILTDVYSLIGRAELKLQRPVAAHFALEQCRKNGASGQLLEETNQIFGEKGNLPLPARQRYAFKTPAGTITGERRQLWDKCLGPKATGEMPTSEALVEALECFEELTRRDETDAAAWFNLGIGRAWRGENAAAIDALDRYVQLEPDEEQAATAWELAILLSYARGLEDRADYVQHMIAFRISDPNLFSQCMGDFQNQGRLARARVAEDTGVVHGIILRKAGLVTGGGMPSGPVEAGASFMIIGDLFQLWNVDEASLEPIRQEFVVGAGAGVTDSRKRRLAANFNEVIIQAASSWIDDSPAGAETLPKLIQSFFEDKWIHRPMRSLAGVPPVDAVGQPNLKKKLHGLVRYVEDCAKGIQGWQYDFARLRERLGLDGTVPAQTTASPGAAINFASLGAAELAQLPIQQLTGEQLEQAFHSARKLEARELMERFARQLVVQPASAGGADRYAIFNHLITSAVTQANREEAIEWVDAGMKQDCEQNEGKRRNDYELRRGQVLAKLGDAQAAREVFERLLARVPGELRLCGSATEAMLSAKEGKAALHFAERGLAQAREKNDRDSENYFKELTEAARKQGA